MLVPSTAIFDFSNRTADSFAGSFVAIRMRRSYASDLRKIFSCAVESVQPSTLFSEFQFQKRVNNSECRELLQALHRPNHSACIADKKCHLVGFGKAVLGMAVQVERILGERLVSGIVSIPTGTLEKFKGVADMTLRKQTVIEVHEGAADNLPDRNAMLAAEKIKSLAESMTRDDVLFVLISGGGSALLPIPVQPIDLTQKTELIRTLARKGANIEELNIVRIAMSQTKGGKLAYAAKNAYRMFSLVISDIVNDPLHLIASGPTVECVNDGRTAKGVLEKFQLWNKLDPELIEVFQRSYNCSLGQTKNHFCFLIGNNATAAVAALECSQNLGYRSCILSTSIVSPLDQLVRTYTLFLTALQQYLNCAIDERQFSAIFPFSLDSFQRLLKTIRICEPGAALCLILAGEPTVHVKGSGKGGRNQELALRMSKIFHEAPLLGKMQFLSAGTDGIDGPTDAAGAIGSAELVQEFVKNSTVGDLLSFLERNDSYNFYKSPGQKDFHIVTGHTGTNVMDIHLIVVPVSGRSRL